MKKCPTCEKTFEDSMRFCQVDGTPLVDDAPAFDPYATIVAQPIPKAEPVEEAPEEHAVESPAEAPEMAAEESADNPTIGSLPIAEPEDVLDLPQNDPLRTMYVSEDEMQAALDEQAAAADEPEIIDIPPIETTPAPEPPSFNLPDVPAPDFGAVPPPPSPFSSDEEEVDDEAATVVGAPAPPPFEEAATMIQPDFQMEPSSPEPEWAPPPPPEAEWPQEAAPVAEWTPPPVPDASWKDQEIGSNTPFQPPPAGTSGENKTLAIVSLVVGILSLFCCGWFIPGIAAIVTGFMARSKATQNPNEYGGAGLALGGIITGAFSIVLGIIVVILYFAGFLASLAR